MPTRDRRPARHGPASDLRRWVVVCVGVVLPVGPVVAQPSQLPATVAPVARPVPTTIPGTSDCDRPTDLPPLLAVPQPGAASPNTAGPRGPGGEYDPKYFYIPEQAPVAASPAASAFGPDGRFWINTTAELAWTKPAHTPPLVQLGSPGGPFIFGNSDLSGDARAGIGVSTGYWLDANREHGIDVSFLYLFQTGTGSTIFSNGATFLLPTAGGGTFTLANPTTGYDGAYQEGITTRYLTADVNYRENLLFGPAGRLDALVGYRFADLGEDLTLYGKRLGPGGQIVRFRDDIGASNQFHGGQLGLAGEYWFGKWYLNGNVKVGLGTVFIDTDSMGKFRVETVVMPFGFYSRPGENGPRNYADFAVMPSAGLTFGRQITEHWRVFVGYNFQYLSHVIRAPDVIDTTPPVTNANPFQVNPANPARRDAVTSDFWVSSLSLGLEWRY